MIKITIELWPHGDKTKSKIIGTAWIHNTGTGDIKRGNYEAVIYTTRNRPWRTVDIVGFARKSRNVWYLLKEILKEI